MKKENANAPKYYTKALRCPDGSRKYIRGKTQAELDRKVREAQAELGLGININDNTTVAELAQTWVDAYKRPKLKPGTLKALLCKLNTHIIPVIGHMRVRDVKPADCALVLSHMSDRKNSFQKDVRGTMKALFTCAIENNIIARNPVTRGVSAGGKESQPRTPLTRDQLEQVYAHLLRRNKRELYTFTLLASQTGLREGEALGLCWDCVDFERGQIHVRRQYVYHAGQGQITETLKTKSSRRDIPMPPMLYAHLLELKKASTGHTVFDLSRPSMARIPHGLKHMCNVNCRGEPRSCKPNVAALDFYVHPHLLRHTYATMCIEAGMDIKEVQYLLGHSTSKMTMDVYAHYVAEARQQETAQKLSAVFPTKLVAV